ncbi:thiamine biosynthesis lipoprotein ApbE precursor [bacterium BMS3Bbin09]|nr:thiamine biosynthesis lipoprotein ApbE precursor [bacterium BMS3Bbin09]
MKINKFYTALVCVLCSVLFALVLSSCTRKEKMYKESRTLMDTYCTITVVSPSKEKAAEAIDKGFAEIKKLELLLNYFSDESEITAVNKAAGTGPVKVSGETLEMMQKTLEISKATNGTFDPTIAPVLKLWKFSGRPADPSIPDSDALERALKLVNYKKIRINGKSSTAYLEDKAMEIDLGGIAKGYAADKAMKAIKAEGINAALVAVAGDIRGFGLNASGKAWKVGIQDPRPETRSEKPWEDLFASLYLEDMAISTSGDYQRFFIKDGKRYHHIIDPATGFPAETDLISASVIAPQGYIADGLSTAVFALGSEKGMSLLKVMGIEGVLVDRDRNVFVTEGIRKKINILKNEYRINEQN